MENTVETKKVEARNRKQLLIRKILAFQSGNKYTEELLSEKTLKQLEHIYDKEVR